MASSTRPSGRHYWWQFGNCWLGLAHRVRIGESGGYTSLIYPAWGLIGISLGLLAGASYLATTAAATYYLTQKRGYSSIGWTDVAFPWNWEELRHKQGLELLDQARDLVRARKLRESLFLLQAGLRLAPEHLQARTTLAQIQSLMRRDDLAGETLAGGIPYAASDPAFADGAIAAHLAAGNFETVLALADQWFALPARDTSKDRAIRLNMARALGLLGREEEALAIVQDERLNASPVGTLLRAQVLWLNGKRDEAVQVITQGIARHPTEDALLVRLVDYCNQLGRDRHAELALASRALAAPDLPSAARDHIVWLAEHNHADLPSRIDRYFAHFSTDPAALLDLAEHTARLGRLEIADRALAAIAATDARVPGLQLARVQSLLAARKPQLALEALEAWKKDHLETHPEKELEVQIYSTLGQMDLQDPSAGLAAFSSLLTSREIGPSGFLRLARHLGSIGRPNEALLAARRARDLAPAEPAILRGACRIFTRHGDWESVALTLDPLLSSRIADYALLNELSASLNSDRTVFVAGRASLLARIEQRRNATKGS